MINPRHSLYRSLLLGFLLVAAGISNAAATVSVVATIKPIHSLVANLMLDIGEPELLISNQQSPHHFHLRPSDARKLAQAQLVIWVGETLETGLKSKMQALAEDATIVTLVEEEAEHDHSSHAHEHHGADPHIWLSPIESIEIVHKVLPVLIQLDETHRETYQANAKRLTTRLQQLDKELRLLLQPVAGVPYIVYHDAYSQLEKRYGLNRVASITLSAERQPGAKKIAELQSLIKNKGVRCLFSEPQFSPKLAQRLLEDSDAKSGILDPVGSELSAGPEHYFQLMHQLGQNLRNCLAE